MSKKSFRMPIALFMVVLALTVLAVQGCSSTEQTQDAEEPTQEGTAQETTASVEPTTSEEGALYTPTYKPNGEEIAVIETDKGTIRLKFYPEDAPNHVAAFIELAQKGFYDGTKFHRVEPNFVIQGGDPLSKTDDPMVGTGGPGYGLAAEFNSRQHLDGTLAMARSTDPNSAGSQFYICLGAQPFLDGQYTVFGEVIEGLDVVHSIAVGDVMNSVTIENATE